MIDRYIYIYRERDVCIIRVHVCVQIVGETITSLQDGIDYLSWTFLFRRLLVNPSYYDLKDTSAEGMNVFLSDLISNTVTDLEEAGCVEFQDDAILPTFLGMYIHVEHD